LGDLVDLAVAFLELRRLGHQLVGPTVLADLFELAKALLDALDFLSQFGRNVSRLRMHAAVLRQEVVIGIEHRLGPRPLRTQFRGFRFELLDREPAHERGVVHKAFVVAAEEIACDFAAGGLVGRSADKQAEIGIERDGGLGQEMPDRIRLDVRTVLDLAPHRELRRVIGAECEGRDHLEADRAGAEGVEQFGRELAKAQPLLDVPFGNAEARCDRLDRLAGVDQCSHGGKFVGRMHGGTHRVFHQRGFDRVLGLLDLAGDFGVRVDDAFRGEFLQDPEAAAAGIDLVDAFAVDPRGMNDQVLQNAFGADAGFQRRILGGRGRGLAHIGRGKHELAETDILDFAADGHGWGLLRRAGASRSLALENPSQIPPRPSSS
jgi:hypothetical protein